MVTITCNTMRWCLGNTMSCLSVAMIGSQMVITMTIVKHTMESPDHTSVKSDWAELRTLISGGTSVVGSSGGSCLSGIVRNLDEDEVAHYISGYDLKYSSGRVGNLDALTQSILTVN